MRAMTYARFGDPGVLRLEEIATPEPGPGEVRVAVRAAAVDYPDWAFVRGSPSQRRRTPWPGSPPT